MIQHASRRRIARRSVVAGLAGASVAGLFAPAIVRAQQPRRFLRPIVAGLNGRQGDPTYDSIARIPQILREKHNVQLEIQVPDGPGSFEHAKHIGNSTHGENQQDPDSSYASPT